MARPKNSDSAVVFQKLLDAGASLIAELGPGAVSLRAVARKAGVSVGTASYYFGSKDELFNAILKSTYDGLFELQGELMQRLVPGAPPRVFVEEVVRAFYRHVRAHRAPLLFNLIVVLNRGLRHRAEKYPTLDAVADVAGAFCGIEPKEMRMHFQSVMFIIVRWALLSEDDMRLITDLPPGAGDAQLSRYIEEHVVRAVLRLLALT
jgi:AcrR family transcriptional regulator